MRKFGLAAVTLGLVISTSVYAVNPKDSKRVGKVYEHLFSGLDVEVGNATLLLPSGFLSVDIMISSAGLWYRGPTAKAQAVGDFDRAVYLVFDQSEGGFNELTPTRETYILSADEEAQEQGLLDADFPRAQMRVENERAEVFGEHNEFQVTVHRWRQDGRTMASLQFYSFYVEDVAEQPQRPTVVSFTLPDLRLRPIAQHGAELLIQDAPKASACDTWLRDMKPASNSVH